eukprot:TRINITY_DN552_c0_g2_i1.p3 TRINITY_DN552_c0_g2~~TRINITY_DN552_c0_g2_i1.p3  ORF type:complete len:365 (-),score=55.88 TRINITY_DN552_c0_g2_i1:2723-3817(-)
MQDNTQIITTHQSAQQSLTMESKDEQEVREFVKHPLNAVEFDPNDPLIEGLQVLALESDPDLAARSALEYGLDFLKQPGKANVREAIAAISEGLNRKSPVAETNQKLLTQRAKCQLSLANYGYAIADLDKAISLLPKPELYDMKAEALFAVGKYKDVIKLYETYPKKEELSKETLKTYQNSIKADKAEEEKKAKLESTKKKQKSEKGQIVSALKKKGLKIGARLHNIPQMMDAKITLDASGKLHFPALIMYEESMQCDLIKDFPEDSTLGAQVGEILYQGLPWDTARAYRMGNVEVYFETNMTKPLDPSCKLVETKEKWKKCDLDAKVVDVIKDEHYIIPQFLVFYVVAKGTPFYQAFLANKQL